MSPPPAPLLPLRQPCAPPPTTTPPHRYVRSSHLAGIQEHFEHFSISKIREADHWIHADQPDALLVIASNFLDVPPAAGR